MELLFTPCIDQDVHVLFLQQISQSDPTAVHVIIQDQAGSHVEAADPRLPVNVRLLPLPRYSPELNPVKKLGDLVKDQVCNRLYPSLANSRIASSALFALGVPMERKWRS